MTKPNQKMFSSSFRDKQLLARRNPLCIVDEEKYMKNDMAADWLRSHKKWRSRKRRKTRHD